MNGVRRFADAAGTALINGLNVSQPDHQPIATVGLADSTPKSPCDLASNEEQLAKLVMVTGAAIFAGSVALEGAGVFENATQYGGLGGVGGFVVGALLYGIEKITNRR